MRYLVLGAGALGGHFGARLIKGGADVTFQVRPRREQQLQRDGLIVHTQDGETLRYTVRTVQRGGIDKPFDVVLLTCKSYDLESAMDAIAPAVGPGTAILPVLNGIRHIDVLKERFGAAQVLGGITVINAALLPDGAIQQSQVRINMNHLGELDCKKSARCIAISQALTPDSPQSDRRRHPRRYRSRGMRLVAGQSQRRQPIADVPHACLSGSVDRYVRCGS